MKTKEQIAAANQHASFMRGWHDGASVSAMRSEFDSHADEGIRNAYNLGYQSGRDDRSFASQRASLLYGYEPEILRLQSAGES